MSNIEQIAPAVLAKIYPAILLLADYKLVTQPLYVVLFSKITVCHYGKRQFPFVCCKWKTETANFRLFAANGNEKWKFYLPWSANDKR
jgi:hypothetical protein